MPQRFLQDARDASAHLNVREEALGLLLRIVSENDGSVPLPAMLSRISSCRGLSSPQEAFLADLVYGVLRLSSLLDMASATFLSHPGKLSPMMRMLLRSASYEVLCMKNVPCRATVDECVSIAKRRFGTRAAGFFNAVLRRMSQEAPRLADRISESICHLDASSSPHDIARCASIPLWLSERWSKYYGAGTAAAIARGMVHAPRACWRVNAARPGWRDLLAEWLSLGCTESGAHGFFSSFPEDMSPGMQEHLWQRLAALENSGAVSRQGSPSQIVAEAVASRLGLLHGSQTGLWDCCCGRGGKTAAMAEQGVRICLASDPSLFRLDALRRQFSRLDIPCPPVLRTDAQEVSGRRFGAVFVDAPCSGTGTLSRNPELRYRLSPRKIAAASSLQKNILDSVWQNLQPGGLLFYSTCALEPIENEMQVRLFAARHTGASVESMRTYFPVFPGDDSLFLSVVRKDA